MAVTQSPLWVDIHEGQKVDAGAFKALVKAAVAENKR